MVEGAREPLLGIPNLMSNDPKSKWSRSMAGVYMGWYPMTAILRLDDTVQQPTQEKRAKVWGDLKLPCTAAFEGKISGCCLHRVVC